MASRITDYDFYLFREGTHYRSWEVLGAHSGEHEGTRGVYFAVWAPNARHVAVIGDFNSWNKHADALHSCGESGIWEGFVAGACTGQAYKYYIVSNNAGVEIEKSDPYALQFEVPPRSASIVAEIGGYVWKDQEWMKRRASHNSLRAPISVYEVHLGSWMRGGEQGGEFLSYRDLAQKLSRYVQEMGFTHVEFMPVTEHPYDGSWGYQTIGYFAPTSRFGTPQDFKFLVDTLHQHGIGVILDWVPSHFPTDGHGLALFDGTHLYEHEDPRQGYHPDWGTLIFNYGRTEVANFLLSSGLYWLEQYHIDGLRVDAVASMIYLDYSRKEHEWIPNPHGGRENLEALEFLKRFNTLAYERFPDTMTFAEESTAWPAVSRPTYLGGLGFGLKWNMGWMNDVLSYFSKDPIHRAYHHNNLTFGLLYAFHENFILPLSHDEVVHGKGSLLSRMPGDDWQKFSNLRLLLSFMFAHPGKKLLFMGAEIGQWGEWNHQRSLDWHLLQYPAHEALRKFVEDLNHLYRSAAPLFEVDFEPRGFTWIDCHDHDQSVLSFLRYGNNADDVMLVALNFTPVPRMNYRIGVDHSGFWEECLNSDADCYGGSGLGNLGGVCTDEVSSHGRPFSLNLTLPPLAAVFFRWERGHGES